MFSVVLIFHEPYAQKVSTISVFLRSLYSTYTCPWDSVTSTLCIFWERTEHLCVHGQGVSLRDPRLRFQGLWHPSLWIKHQFPNKHAVQTFANIWTLGLPNKDFENWHICFKSKQINDRLGLLGCTIILFTFPRIALNKESSQQVELLPFKQLDSWDETSISKIFSWSDLWNLKQVRLTKNLIRWYDWVNTPLIHKPFCLKHMHGSILSVILYKNSRILWHPEIFDFDVYITHFPWFYLWSPGH